MRKEKATGYKPIIQVDPDTYLYGIWFLPNGDEFDVMGCLSKQRGSDHWDFRYRFRYYDESGTDGDPFESHDEKSVYHARIPCTEKTNKVVLDGIALMFRELSNRTATQMKPDFIDIRMWGTSENIDAILNKMSDKPWIHMRKESA